ncbi:UNVERIFIED_CONTAM: hypothetical protein Sangu_1714000 [Sesamum angustifolium]|uniref:Uncharacterized protein n=1 Tax=Sesamum angustifolium TaxID=2727405 RepID=A0AAW2MJZ4_9LAMI
MLLQAGKGVLVKAVLQSLPIYAMSCFHMPMGLVRELESLMADFWCHSRGDKRVHWIAQRKLFRTPTKGGLGFHELRAFNMALLAKQGWRILTCVEAQVFSNILVHRSRSGCRPSQIWLGIWEAKHVVAKGCRQDEEGVWR